MPIRLPDLHFNTAAEAQKKAAAKAREKAERAKKKARDRKATRRAVAVAPWVGLATLIALWPSKSFGRFGDLPANTLASRERGRGRDAEAPQDIPPRGWKDIFWRTFKEYNDDQIPRVAGGVTFFGLLALFPGIAAFVASYGLFADIQDVRKHLAAIAGVMPADVLKFVTEQMVRLAGQHDAGLSFTFATTLVLSIWSANAGMKALFSGLNIAYDEREKRNFFKLNAISLIFTVAALVFLLAAIGAVAVVPVIFSLAGLDVGLFGLLRWPVLFVAMVAALSVVYRFGPSRAHARWRWVTPGSVVAAVLWIAGSVVFSWYLANFAHYDRTYGSMGAAVGVMTWLWLSSIIILVGAELNSEIEHQTARDSTTGAPQPLGSRGAAMADTVGEAKL
jgi:membrane protein